MILTENALSEMTGWFCLILTIKSGNGRNGWNAFLAFPFLFRTFVLDD